MVKIIAFISQKGGVGKSTLARALAVEATKRGLKVLLADCDPQQKTSFEWTQWRKENNITPSITSQIFNSVKEIWPLTKNYDLIIIDAPARTSQATQEIAQQANLLVQPVGASRDDLLPAIREFNALKAQGIKKDKLCFVLNHLSTPAEVSATQAYLRESGYPFIRIFLYERASYRQAQNEGKSITESNFPSLKEQAQALINELLKRIEVLK
ncbi:MAG: ParA family protein [Candidatus Moeniiplasma glomeromycotorum]|nr:ParA family protein [Candidatus Moeniiplasma glomeromycotorum]